MRKPNYRQHEEARAAARQALREAIIDEIRDRIAASGPQMRNHDDIAWLVIGHERAAMAAFFENIFCDVIDAVPTVGNEAPPPLPPDECAEADRAIAADAALLAAERNREEASS